MTHLLVVSMARCHEAQTRKRGRGEFRSISCRWADLWSTRENSRGGGPDLSTAKRPFMFREFAIIRPQLHVDHVLFALSGLFNVALMG